MRILLTGSSGFIGTHTAAALKGHAVTAVVRRAGSAPQHTQEVVAELHDLKDVVAAVRPEVVVHLAARLKTDDANWEYVTSNVTATLALLEACRLHKPALVHTSTMSVYDFADPRYLPVDERHPFAPKHMYGETKLASEALCRAYGLSHGVGTIILRLPGVYGPGRASGLMHNLISGKPLNVGALQTRRDFIYVKDVARAIALACDAAAQGKSGDANLTGSSAPLGDIIDTVAQVTGRRVEYSVKRSADRDFYFDGKAARELFGFVPQSLKDSVTDYLNEGRPHDTRAEPGAEQNPQRRAALS